jgi:hypothetical protein
MIDLVWTTPLVTLIFGIAILTGISGLYHHFANTVH